MADAPVKGLRGVVGSIVASPLPREYAMLRAFLRARARSGGAGRRESGRSEGGTGRVL